MIRKQNQSAVACHMKRACIPSHSHSCWCFSFLVRTEKQQKETDDTGLHMQYKEDKKQCLSGFILPSLNTSGFAHASRVAHVTSPATKAKVKADKGEEERQQLVRQSLLCMQVSWSLFLNQDFVTIGQSTA